MLHQISRDALDQIISSYAATALWSSYDINDIDASEPFDANYDADDFSDAAMEAIERDVVSFLALLTAIDPEVTADDIVSRMSWAQFGHDFWLTRNGHGAGFWDRGYGEFGDILTKWANTFGESYLYVHIDQTGDIPVTTIEVE